MLAEIMININGLATQIKLQKKYWRKTTMTVEEIELRKILAQMLADNGINRETIKDFVKEIIDEKVDKAIDRIIAETSTQTMDTNVKRRIDRYIDNEISSVVRECVREQIRNTFSRVSVEVNFNDADGNTKRSLLS
jgi:hypothetical protein